MYFKKTSIIIALLLIAAGATYYYSDNSNNSHSAPEANQRQGPYVDSLAPDNRPSFTARRDTVPEPAGENLAPGTALLRTTILNSEVTKFKIRVEEVLGYGSSTPPIAGGTEFVFNVTDYLEQNPQLRDQLTEQNEVRLLISHQKGMRLEESDNPQDWSFVRIESN